MELREEVRFSQDLIQFLKDRTVYDGNNILVILSPNIAKTWTRIDELMGHGFILKSVFGEMDGQDNTFYFEIPDKRKRYDPYPKDDEF